MNTLYFLHGDDYQGKITSKTTTTTTTTTGWVYSFMPSHMNGVNLSWDNFGYYVKRVRCSSNSFSGWVCKLEFMHQGKHILMHLAL